MTVPGSLESVGPYRVLRRLGAGGMGEVYLAHDERLDRRVAIKRVRPEVADSADRRERFRREARVAAQLSHAAIVQVFDVLGDGGVDWIVMEYVEGTTLARAAAGGALELSQVVGLAIEIADGLAAAHVRGVVHRDLKLENVLLTPEGHAKISDFGLAKPLLEPSSLTASDAVLGTYRAMSPEQARGERLEPSSDLFSFGVLLYEMLAGRSPFAGANPLATLQKILNDDQPSLHELAPEVPEALSDLVDQLLMKDSALRPGSAREVAAALRAVATDLPEPTAMATTLAPLTRDAVMPDDATVDVGRVSSSAFREVDSSVWRRPVYRWLALLLVIGLGVASYLALRPAPEPLYVAVRQPRFEGGDEPPLVAAGVHAALLRGLLSFEGVSPKPAEEVDPIVGSAVELARAVAADEVVTTSLECRPATCRVTLQRVNGADGSLLEVDGFDLPADDFDLAARAVDSSLRRVYAGRRLRRGIVDLRVESDDLEELLRLRVDLDRAEIASQDELLARLAALRERTPRLLEVYLLEADILRRRFLSSRQQSHVDRAFDLLERARFLAPGDPRIPASKVVAALDAGQLALAADALGDLERLSPGDVLVQVRRAQLKRAGGEPYAALELMRAAVRRTPSWRWLMMLAIMEYQLGEIAVARDHLQQTLERSPGNYQALSSLALLELVDGDPRRAIELYRQLVAEEPGLAELSNLGLAYMLDRRFEAAANTYRQVYEREPGNAMFALNLADAYQLLGDVATAEKLYDEVIELADSDPSATNWQMLTVKAQALAHRGHARRAVAAIQKALQQAPENSQVLYEAALVYSLVGETASSQVNAERALALGYGKRWFDFPWFDELRASETFMRLKSSENS